MITYLITFIHLLITSYSIFYVIFTTTNKKYDYIYLSYIYFVFLHLTFFKGECILTYFYKKTKDNNYKLGSNDIKDDFDYVFGNYRNYFAIISIIIVIINIFIICIRNNIEKHYFYIFLFLYILYLYAGTIFENKDTNTDFKLFNEIMKILIILFGIYFYINNKALFIINKNFNQ